MVKTNRIQNKVIQTTKSYEESEIYKWNAYNTIFQISNQLHKTSQSLMKYRD